VVARIAMISRQAIYRTPTTTPLSGRRSRPAADDVEAAIIEVAEQNPTDGYRIVREWVCRKLARQVNRKKVLRVMRERKLIQRATREPRRRRPGFFQVQRPAQLWHMDMTSIWVAEHGWVYLNAIIDCCTREIVGWDLSLRCRAVEAIAVIEAAVAGQAPKWTGTLGVAYELRGLAQDALEDGVLMGADEAQLRQVLAGIIAGLVNPYRQ